MLRNKIYWGRILRQINNPIRSCIERARIDFSFLFFSNRRCLHILIKFLDNNISTLSAPLFIFLSGF